MKVLVAEDDALTLMTLAAALRKAGHDVVEAHDGEEAVQLAAATCPDALVIDEKMPRRNGLEAAREIAAARPIPVLLVTSYSDRKVRRDAVETGVHGYLVKPVSGSDLVPALEVACAAAEREVALHTEAEDARHALEERKVVERAKGILMRRGQLTEEEAYLRIQRTSRNENRKMADVARSIVEADQVWKGDAEA